MGRRPTKAADNPFCIARMGAVRGDGRLGSKEYAAEMLGVSVSTLSDYERGVTKTIPPDMVRRMSDLYRAPEIVNYYCREVCPLGGDLPKAELGNLDRAAVKTLSALKKVESLEKIFLEITEDGQITKEERPKLYKVMAMLDGITAAAQDLKIWMEKNL